MKKTRYNSLAVSLCAVGLFTGILSVAKADTIAFTPPVLNSFGGEPTGNDGEFFTPTISIWVTALGYVSPGSSVGNEVGLYNVSTTTLLASTTITSSLTLSGSFLYQTIVPVLLTAGNEYAVSGLYTAGDGAIGYTADSGVGAAPEITFDGYEYDSNSSLDLPTISYTPPIFGPNFEYVPVPEPTMMKIIIVGALLLLPFKANTLRMPRSSATPGR
ncbi:MAG: hypothetical protein ACLQAH_05520 [Limisphaerales bacterium]